LAARALDDEIVRLVLEALSPSALELSLSVTADLRGQFELAEAQWQEKLERAKFEAERARRQYDASEPENRMVARNLETAWEGKLRAHQELIEGHERFLQQQPHALTTDEHERIRNLAADLPALWQATSTTDADRKDIRMRLANPILMAMVRSPRADPSVSRRLQHGQARWQTA
jgi:hypothetical protein